MTDSSPKQLPPYGLRIPPDLKEGIQKAAKENNRSMHAEIIARLEASFRQSIDLQHLVDQAYETERRISSVEAFLARLRDKDHGDPPG